MKKKIVGSFIACGLDPEGIIAMDFRNLKEAKDRVAILDPKPKHWVLHGLLNDELKILCEEKDGEVLIDEFSK